MKKVLVVSTVGLLYDGITNVIVSYLETMNLEELDIYVAATIKFEKNIVKKMGNLGCRIIYLPSRRENTVSYFLNLVLFIRKNNIETIHAHGNSATLAIEMVAGWIGGCKKRIAHSHNTRCDQIKADKLLRPIFKLTYTDALACGYEAGEWLFKDDAFTVLQNGRDVKKYLYCEDIRKKIREKYSLQNKLVVGHVGGFFPQKNHDFLLAIFREVLKKEPNALLVLIGDGPLKEKIESQAKDIEESVTFVGNVDNVSDYLQMMDGMLLPSLFEGLPLVVIEWQINGLPYIISDTVTKDCTFMDNAKFMSLDDTPKEWAENIIKLVKHYNRKEKSIFAEQSVKKAGFDIQQSAQQLRSIYLN